MGHWKVYPQNISLNRFGGGEKMDCPGNNFEYSHSLDINKFNNFIGKLAENTLIKQNSALGELEKSIWST